MPKMKSKRALMKRVKVTGSGELKYIHPYRRHLAPNKTHKQKMHLRKDGIVDSTDFKRIKFLISK
jgi:large subunit ribosomal protein L35